jgi:type I restriction enzyme S subunit
MKYKLSDVMDLIGGGTPKTSKPEYWNGTIPWLSVKDFNNGFRYVYETEKTITELGLENSSTKLLQNGDVIISARGTVGEIATIPFPMAFNQSCYGLRAKSKIVTSDYLYYLIKHNVSVLKKNTHGSVFDTITRKTFDNIEVEIPSIEIQEKIASILSDYDEKIELNNEINNNLERQAQAIFKSWFVDFDPFGGNRPIDWITGIVDDLGAKIICGKTPSTKKKEYYGGNTPFITIPDMHGCVYNVSTERYLSAAGVASQPKKTLPHNTVCISCIGTAGLVTLVSEKSQSNQQINSIIPKEGISAYYIYLLMQTLSETINKLGQSGSTIVNLNKTQFGKIPVTIPSEQVLCNFDTLCKPLFEMILSNQKENIKLANLRDTLLPKLMSGELDVSNIDL